MKLAGRGLSWLAFGSWLLAMSLATLAGHQESPESSALVRLEEARALHRQGDLQAADTLYREVLPVLRQMDDQDALAKTLNGLSLTAMGQGRYLEALEHAREAAALWDQSGDPIGKSMASNNAGLASYHLGDFASALDAYLQALAQDRANQDPEGEVITLNNIGNVHLLRGDYLVGLEYYQQALNVIDAHSGEPWSAGERAVTWTNLAALYQKMGLYRQALDTYEQLQRADLPAESRVQLASNIGALYRHLQDPAKALETYRSAPVGSDPGAVETRIALFKNIGIVLALDFEDYPQAEAAFRSAHSLAERSGDRREQMQTLLYLAETLRRDGRHESAAESFRQSLQWANQLHTVEEIWRAHYGLGRIALENDQPETARGHFEGAADVIESLRSRLQPVTLTGSLLASQRQVYDALIELLLRQPGIDSQPEDFNRLLELMERARSDPFRRRISPALQTVRVDADREGFLQLQRLQEKISVLWEQQLEGRAAGDVSTRLAQAETEYLKVEESLPGLPGETTSVTLESLQSNLRPGTLVLSYWLSETRVGGLAITPGHRFSFLGEFDEAARSALQGCAGALSTGEPQWSTKCDSLSDLLLAPVLSRVDVATVDTLVVVADGLLRTLPFEVLLLPGAERRLIEEFALSYMPGLGFMQEPAETSWRAPWGLTLVGLADPEFDPTDLLAEPDWQRLPHSRTEIEEAARRLPGRSRLLVGAQATRQALRDSLAEPIPVLHLASHAVSDALFPERSRILLASTTDSKLADALFLGDVLALRLTADLVVLSACETAAGSAIGGEIDSLSRAFLLRGASSSLASLWRVDDRSTAELMDGFYGYAAAGLSKAEALRQAKLRFLRSPTGRQHPYYWAGFVLAGRADQPLPLPLTWRAVVTALLVLVVLSIAVLAWRRRRALLERA